MIIDPINTALHSLRKTKSWTSTVTTVGLQFFHTQVTDTRANVFPHKSLGAAYGYIPNVYNAAENGRYPLHIMSEQMLENSPMWGTEIQVASDAATFHVNIIRGTLQTVTPPNRYSDTRNFATGGYYIIGWWLNPVAGGTTKIYVNKVANVIPGLPNLTGAVTMTNHMIRNRGTVAGFKLAYLLVSTDLNLTEAIADKWQASLGPCPRFEGVGLEFQTGIKRCVYFDGSSSTPKNLVTGIDFTYYQAPADGGFSRIEDNVIVSL